VLSRRIKSNVSPTLPMGLKFAPPKINIAPLFAISSKAAYRNWFVGSTQICSAQCVVEIMLQNPQCTNVRSVLTGLTLNPIRWMNKVCMMVE
jgi:hypothetical protein